MGYILRTNCRLKHIIERKIEGGIEVTGIQGRRRKHLLDDLKETRGYCELNEEALDHTVWLWKRLGTCFKTDCRRMMMIIVVVVIIIIVVIIMMVVMMMTTTTMIITSIFYPEDGGGIFLQNFGPNNVVTQRTTV
jgi:hypothetical protein